MVIMRIFNSSFRARFPSHLSAIIEPPLHCQFLLPIIPLHSPPRLSPLIRKREKQREAKKGERRKEGGERDAISTGEIHEKNGVCPRFTIISRSGVRAERKDEHKRLVWLQGGKSKEGSVEKQRGDMRA